MESIQTLIVSSQRVTRKHHHALARVLQYAGHFYLPNVALRVFYLVHVGSEEVQAAQKSVKFESILLNGQGCQRVTFRLYKHSKEINALRIEVILTTS